MLVKIFQHHGDPGDHGAYGDGNHQKKIGWNPGDIGSDAAQVDDGKALDPSSPVGIAGMLVISVAVLPYAVPWQRRRLGLGKGPRE